MPAHGSYRTSAAAKAAGIPLKDFTRNLGRKVIKFAGPDPGKGRPREFNLSNVYSIAIGHALTKVLVPPTAAMDIAKMFLESQRGRKSGKPFESGRTLLLVSNGVGSIINLQADEDIAAYLQDATIVVDIGKIISTVNSRLLHQ
jgi:hypothetical protein